MLFQNFLLVKSSYTKYVLITFSNGLKPCENDVDVVAMFYELLKNVWMILIGVEREWQQACYRSVFRN